ncbi:MAG: MFS transporter [Thermoplasmata archaeon]|nr:MFS transporter [Thermoplasmata archaeon]
MARNLLGEVAGAAAVERNLKLLALGVSVRTFGAALYYPFLALFLYSVLHVGYLEIGVILVGVGAVQLPFGYAGGLLADRVGRRRLILIGLFAEAAATVALAYAFSIRSLPLAILAGTAGGIVTSSAGAAYSAYIADHAAGSDRTRAFTWYRIGFNAGFSAGVGLGGALVAFLGFPLSVAIAAALIASAAVVLSVLLGPSPYDLGLQEKRRVRAAEGGAAAPRGRSLRESLAVLRKDRVALEVALGFLFASLVYGQWAVTFPLFVHNLMGIGYALLGVGLALNGLIVVFGQAPTTEALIGWRHTTLGAMAVGLLAASYLLLGVAGPLLLAPLVAFLAAVVILTVGENIGTIATTTLPSNLAPPEEMGSYNGAFGTFLGAGGLAATFLGGLVLSLTSNPLLIWVLLASPAVPAVLLLRHAAPRIRPEANRV